MNSRTSKARIRPVILSGGSGARLWPLSRLGRPKQLVALVAGEETMLQQAALRVADASLFEPPLVVCSRDHVDTIEAQLAAVGVESARMIVEPVPRNTAPAITLAALSAEQDELLLVMPSDHSIADERAFRAAVEKGAACAEEDWLVTFGIVPTRPETGYGYIRCGREMVSGVYHVACFAEKPDAATAAAFLASGDYRWNSGMFLMRAGACLAAIGSLGGELADDVRHSLTGEWKQELRIVPDEERFGRITSSSFDRLVMERADRVAVVPVDMGWSDIGSWDAIHTLGPPDEDGNVRHGDVVAPGSTGCLIKSDGPTVVALGVSDLIIVATERAVLVVPRGESQRVKEAIDALDARRRPRR